MKSDNISIIYKEAFLLQDEEKVHSKPFYRVFLDYNQDTNKLFILLGLAIAASIASIHFIMSYYMTPKSSIGLLQSPLLSNRKALSCDWSPTHHADCNSILNARLPEVQNNRDGGTERRRFLFFGDSTVARLFKYSVLKSHLITDVLSNMNQACWSTLSGAQGRLQCEERLADRCKFNELFNVEYASEWMAPTPEKFEGPIKYGASNQFCQDCSGCNHNFLHCEIRDAPIESDEQSICDKKRVAYGGYFSIEFARDVEVQSPEHGTTQENVASYLSKSWNNPWPLLETWDKPICVISTGHHDAMIPGITTADYLSNVRWYLSVMLPVCGHVIWLTNNAPATDDTDFPQTVELLKSYNDGVYDLIQSTPELYDKVTFMDVFAASLAWPHGDYIHMDPEWYQNLGSWFTTFM